MSTATLTTMGRAALAAALAARPLHLAWGEGDPAWDGAAGASLPSLVGATALTKEIGRRKVTTVDFVAEAADGEIVVPIGLRPDGTVETARYKRVNAGDVSPNLYLYAAFDYEDAPTATIREVGLFADTVAVSGLPLGQLYFTPGELQNPGKLVAAQILDAPRIRSSSVRETMEFVLPI